MLLHERMLRDEIVVCHVQCFRQASRARGKQTPSDGILASFFVVEPFPVGFPLQLKPLPGSQI
jgi:hypothetical protein